MGFRFYTYNKSYKYKKGYISAPKARYCALQRTQHRHFKAEL